MDDMRENKNFKDSYLRKILQNFFKIEVDRKKTGS